MADSKRELDLVVFGASGFTGRIVCEYLRDYSAEKEPLHWGIAGRSRARLQDVQHALNIAQDLVPLISLDNTDTSELIALCCRTSVVLSTAGPYALYGSQLVAACVETGTDYVDLSGESQWIRRMVMQYEQRAITSGARIIHSCGFDSIPSDLGVYFLQQQSHARFGQAADRVIMRVKAIRGGLSGGTIASGLNAAAEAATDPGVRRELSDPYSLCVGLDVEPVKQNQVRFPKFDRVIGSWVTPFLMAGINTQTVLRSSALMPKQFPSRFRYDEALLTGKGLRGAWRAATTALGLGLFLLATSTTRTRNFLQRLCPKPGDGPDRAKREAGFFELKFTGWTNDSKTTRVKVTGNQDPGYNTTAKMICQAAICLARDKTDIETSGGFWTPARAMGVRLIERLRAYTGMTFELED
ncbi:MAG: saccharopine dehydrogenase NADP-binding domain-containing protein [Pseudomonadota bacterium]|nr:saccharopine dehydrogenase NADP-binding domain-containing protein [Pseudomonadota bacterium]